MSLPGVDEFHDRVLSDLSASMTTVFCALGDRLGLFRLLAQGPSTSSELAASGKLDERHVREWAHGLFAAGYLGYDPATRRYQLDPAQRAVLAADGEPTCLAGAHHVFMELLKVLGPLEQAFRKGGGVSAATYSDEFWSGMQRMTGINFDHKLIQDWLPRTGLMSRLESGIRVADIGCGVGQAMIRIGTAFPKSTCVGFDIFEPNVQRAQSAARAAGVDSRVSFQCHDVVGGLPATFDLITIFDVAHDSADPVRLLRAARASLEPGGACMILEMKSEDGVENNRGSSAALLYGFSLLHCMTQSLATGGAGVGTCGLPEGHLRQICREVGFASLEKVAEEMLDVLYIART